MADNRGSTGGLIGVLIGALAVVVAIVGAGAYASAQSGPIVVAQEEDESGGDDAGTEENDTPEADEADDNDVPEAAPEADGQDADGGEDAEWEAYEQCFADVFGDFDLFDLELDGDHGGFFGFGFGDAEDVPAPGGSGGSAGGAFSFPELDGPCQDLLPQELAQELEQWAPFEECLSGVFGELFGENGEGLEGVFGEGGPDFEALERAGQNCEALLPEGLQDELERFEPFEQCMAGLDPIDGMGGVVHIDDAGNFSVVQFSDEPGTATITGTAGNLSVEVTGGATIVAEGDLDQLFDMELELFGECEELIPEMEELDG